MLCVLLPLGVNTVCSIVVMMFCVGVCCEVISLVVLCSGGCWNFLCSDVKGWLRIVVFVVGRRVAVRLHGGGTLGALCIGSVVLLL